MELVHLFAEASGNGDNQRPGILRRSPRGFGRRIVLDVAVTAGLDGQSRPTDDSPDRHLQIQHDQKMAKCDQTAEHNIFHFVPVIFSRAGQIHGFLNR